MKSFDRFAGRTRRHHRPILSWRVKFTKMFAGLVLRSPPPRSRITRITFYAGVNKLIVIDRRRLVARTGLMLSLRHFRAALGIPSWKTSFNRSPPPRKPVVPTAFALFDYLASSGKADTSGYEVRCVCHPLPSWDLCMSRQPVAR